MMVMVFVVGGVRPAKPAEGGGERPDDGLPDWQPMFQTISNTRPITPLTTGKRER